MTKHATAAKPIPPSKVDINVSKTAGGMLHWEAAQIAVDSASTRKQLVKYIQYSISCGYGEAIDSRKRYNS